MKNLWDYEEELKGLGHRLSKELPRYHLEYALAHVRQAIRAELYDEDETPEETQKAIRQFLALNEKLKLKRKESLKHGTD